jgi:peptide/nickel transport system ATP-binding protein
MIALALSCNPDMVIADEPTTALDVVIQDQILKEIKKIQKLLGLSLIYISHDIAVIAEMTDNMAVMYAGHIIEKGPTKLLFNNPQHSYTKLLLESTPSIVGSKIKLRALEGEPPSLINITDKCAFSPRCPEPSKDCKDGIISMKLIEKDQDHWVDQCCVNCG